MNARKLMQTRGSKILAFGVTLAILVSSASLAASAAPARDAAQATRAGAASAPTMVAPPPPPTPDPDLRFHTIVAPDGVPLNVVEAGRSDGPAILLLHGYSQSYLSWHAQLHDPALTERFRLVAVDLRGHGASGKPWQPSAYAGSKPWADDLRAVATALRLERPLVVGWSFGGYVAFDYVREYGSRAVAGVMLAGSHGGLLPRPPAPATATVPDLDVAIASAHQFMSLMSAEPLPAAAMERGVASFLMLPPYVRTATLQKRLDNTDLASHLDLPVRAVLGGADPSVPAAALRTVLAAAPDAQLSVYPGVGHSSFAEAPARFDADLATFAAVVLQGLPEPVARYVAAVNAGDATAAVAAFAEDATMHLTGGREARGRAALRAIEDFHAAVRPTIAPVGLVPRRDGDRIVVALERNVETSPMFTAMGLRRVTTEPVADAFVVENGGIVSARQPEFAAACREVMGRALPAFRQWLDERRDPRIALLYAGAAPRIEASTAPTWLGALREWREQSGWEPDAAARDRCERGD